MHTVTLTITEILTLGTFILLHPLAMAIGMIAILPDIHEIILVDVSLIIVCTDAGTGSDGTVGHHRTHRYTSLA